MSSLVMTDTQYAKQILCPRQKREKSNTIRLFRARGVLGDSLGTLRNSVLGQLSGKDEADTVKWSVGVIESIETRDTHEVWISREEMVDFLL